MSTLATNPNPLRHSLRLFFPFAVGYYLSYLLRNANAVLAPELTHELTLTAADLGLLTGAYFFAFGVFQIPLGILLDRYGARRIESALMLVAAAGTLVFALGHDIVALTIGRGLIGLGVSSCLMAGLKHFSQWYPPERQSSLTGAIMTAGGLGAISASVPMEALLPLLDWRGVFFLLTAIIFLSAVYIFFAVPDRNHSQPQTNQWRGVVRIFADRQFWRFAPLMMCFSGGSMAVAGLWVVPWFINAEGLTRDAAAQNLMAMGIASLSSFFAIAAFGTQLIRRGVRLSRLVGTVLVISWSCLVLILLGARPSAPFWVVSSFFASTTTLMYAALAANFAPALFGRVSTALNLMAFIGAFSLQWGLGAMIDFFVSINWSMANAFRAAFAIMALLQLLSWIWYVWEGRRQSAAGRVTVQTATLEP